MKYLIEVDDCDLADMAVGRFVRECPVAADAIGGTADASDFLDADPNTAKMAIVPHARWLVTVLPDEEVQRLAKELGARARLVGKEVYDSSDGEEQAEPWRT